jgi:hypothetical protein
MPCGISANGFFPCLPARRSSMPWWSMRHQEIDARPGETGGWWHVYQLLLPDARDSFPSIFHDPAQRPPFRDGSRFYFRVLAACWSQPT